jgi:NADP-dependent 3-hydroxy acid dehydrogenase YdfG
MKQNRQGKIAVITGASSGLGAAAAELGGVNISFSYFIVS